MKPWRSLGNTDDGQGRVGNTDEPFVDLIRQSLPIASRGRFGASDAGHVLRGSRRARGLGLSMRSGHSCDAHKALPDAGWLD